jgi:acetyl esterase
MTDYNLERAAAEVAGYLSQGPGLETMTPAAARALIDGAAPEPSFVDVDESWITVPAEVGDVQVLLIRPQGAAEELPVILYMHGGGWVLGSIKSHGRFARELAVGADAAVAFIDYSLAPEAQYPVQLEQCYAVARWVTDQGADHALDTMRIAVAGDSAGGNMAAVLTLMAKQREDVSFVQQSMYYPITDSAGDTESYQLFKDGPYGTAATMRWFLDNYLPDQELKSEITVSPLRAALEDLDGLPPALVIVDENDVLRDEGEAYADKLRAAGVPTTSVRFNGTMHDFLSLGALRDTEATKAGMTLATEALRRAFGSHSR